MKVEYHSKEGAPGKYFTCPSGFGVMSTTFCSESHLKAGTKEYISENRRAACRFCRLGAVHSGARGTLNGSRLYKRFICSRCERNCTRLVNSRLCVGCYNRQSECRKGKNAKGAPLLFVRQYRDIRLLVIKENQVQLSTANQVMTLSECVIGALVNTPENLSFGWVGVGILPSTN